MPVSPVGDNPLRLATVPVVLCTLAYSWYRATTFFPWGPYEPGFTPAEQVLGVAVIAALGVVQILFAFRRPSRAGAGLLLAVQVVLAYAPYLVYGGRWDPPAAFVVAAVLLTVAGRRAWSVAALAVLCDVTVRIALEPGLVDADGGIVATRVAYAVIVAIANGSLLFGMSHLSALVRDLDAARSASASVEVARERLRIARRLQDAVGGRLVSVIATLRPADGEAARESDAGRTGDRARAVAATAREALARVRTVADDYRDRSLAGEVAAARTVLAAAGVEVTVGAVPERLPGLVDALLGAVLRRTVIDALRGTPPDAWRIDLDASASMRVTFAGGEPGAMTTDGLAEEAEHLGGRLRAGTGGVEVVIPVDPRRPGGTPGPRPAVAAPWLAWGIVAVLEVDLLIATLSRVTGAWAFYEAVAMPRLVLIVALSVPLSLLQLHHVRPRRGGTPPWWRWTLALQITIVVAIALVGSPVSLAQQYAGTVAGVVLFHVRRPWSWALAGTLIVGTALFDQYRLGVELTGNLPRMAWMTLVAAAWALLAMVAIAALCRLPLAAEELIAARREVARLAVLRERLRIARDTHDLLGFQLSAIALKADLAGRLIATDPGAARIHLAEAGRAAEEALTSLRSITAEPTRLTFAEEVESARSMLTAAGARVTVQLHAAPGPPAGSPLAIVLREAATNVVRHSRATTCEIETGQVPGGVRLRVTNDGVPSRPGDAAAGNGLANLLQRARESGGTLTTHRQGDRFTLVAEIPTTGLDRTSPDVAVPVAV